MRREVLLSLAAVALLSPAALPAPPAIDIPPEVRPAGQYALFDPKTDAVSVEYVGLDGLDPVPSRILKDPRTFFLDTRGLKAGRYRFIAVAASKDGEQVRAAFAVLVGDQPVPPGPGPGPGPDPPPTPGVLPISGEGLRVLVILESADKTKLPAAQVAMLNSAEVYNYLQSKTAVGPGGTHEWRIWDKDVNTAAVAKNWQDAMKRPRTQTPWVMIANGKTGYEGPLPGTLPEFMALLKKYGGE